MVARLGPHVQTIHAVWGRLEMEGPEAGTLDEEGRLAIGAENPMAVRFALDMEALEAAGWAVEFFE
eukprot:1746220-Lingulodinium_polyedra.AAC.1